MNSKSNHLENESAQSIERTIDGVVFDGTQSEAACLKCDGVLDVGHLHGFKVAACRHCHGILVESRLFAGLISVSRSNYEGESTTPEPRNPELLKERSQCIVCAAEMDTHFYAGPGNVVIDNCHQCGLVWLDATEWEGIVKAPGSREIRVKDLLDQEVPNQAEQKPASVDTMLNLLTILLR